MPTNLCLAIIIWMSVVPLHGQTALRGAFKGQFLIGAALNENQFSGSDTRGEAIARIHFNTISPENMLKWQSLQPDEGKFTFAGADRYVRFGEKNEMHIVGHALVWHHQTPKWVF